MRWSGFAPCAGVCADLAAPGPLMLPLSAPPMAPGAWCSVLSGLAALPPLGACIVCADARPATPTMAAAATVVSNIFLIMRLLFSLKKSRDGALHPQTAFPIDHALQPQLKCEARVPILTAGICSNWRFRRAGGTFLG